MSDTGAHYPGTMADVDYLGYNSWQDVNYAKANDGSVAYVSMSAGGDYSDYLAATNFSMGVPVGATITGLKIALEANSDTVDRDLIYNARFTKDGSTLVGTESGYMPSSGYLTTTLTAYSYGGDGYLFGTTWTAAEVNASTFGVFVLARDMGGAGGSTVSIDYISITVYYTEGWSGEVMSITNPASVMGLVKASLKGVMGEQ